MHRNQACPTHMVDFEEDASSLTLRGAACRIQPRALQIASASMLAGSSHLLLPSQHRNPSKSEGTRIR